MSFHRATVNKILTYSVVDGPGNRLVVFLQGCNFACAGCHNPYTIGNCNHCGDCVPVCEAGALSLVDGKIAFDPDRCTQCDDCLTVCPISASPMVQEMGVGDILHIARDHRPFLSGITVSGGESTVQIKFVIELFEAVKSDPALAGLTCFVDSNGHLGPAAWQNLLQVSDGVMLDIKAFDPALHHDLTGQDNTKALQSVQTVHRAGKLHELRFLVIPDKTDTAAELDSLTRLVLSLGKDTRIRLNAFQRHGVRGAAQYWPAMGKTRIESMATHLRNAGILQVSTPAVYL